MQLLSVKTTISKEKKHSMFYFAFENMKKLPTKMAHNWLQFFFQYCQQAQNQPKSHSFSIKMAPCATSI